MSNITGGDGGSFSSGNITGGEEVHQQQQELLNHFNHSSNGSTTKQQQPPPVKKKRNQPGTPDPAAEVIALSPTTLMATNRFVCEICKKGFQRDQNLQLHRRGHNLPWKLKQRTSTEIRKRVYVCPEPSCVHHNPARALGDLTGIKKHFCRKHGEKKWKCEKCSKKYAVQSDWKAHLKTCGTREYKCDCGTIFSRRDSFITHRAFCDALSDENNKAKQGILSTMGASLQGQAVSELISSIPINNNPRSSSGLTSGFDQTDHHHHHHDAKAPLSLPQKPLHMTAGNLFSNNPRSLSSSSPHSLQPSMNSSSIFEGNGHLFPGSALMSATALLQKAAQMGATASASGMNCQLMQNNFVTSMAPPSFGAMQPQMNDQSFANQFIDQKGGQHEISPQFLNANGMLDNLGLSNMAMLNGLLDQNNALLKNMKHDSSINGNINVLHGGNSNGATVSRDMTTVDFLGLGGGPLRRGNSHEKQQQKQKDQMGFEGIGQRIQGFSHFQQQALMEKSIWEV
ncbi:hypothetical protein FH972_006610 [Carpinus fangiana]|uniref:C2H2-type domain-containing protein n=1 Tax=Carpinus fangiana TaxID=176857 RepID=A0A5N6QVS7_9ROSI|nr:hypothetical protein FH972_006610 [Carpinus fangiana]